ncbi:60S ribosomal subunit assembly or modification protein [Entomophthora muscae]|uniref:60S ribosomal subunit assembly or modification protein n=1 Tax=Entomophthora muscae TaxID=34485 RepID=A0ACC2TS10_9FUNG|nr:60S ribosomal subunit assembly or modification protein [Entomophthora muscae]
MVMSGGGDDRAYIWDRSNGETLHKLEAHGDSVIAVGFSADGKLAASGGMDGKIQVFNASTGALVICLEGPDEVTWLQWHPKGPVLLVGAADSSIWMFQLPSGQVMNVFSGHSAAVTCGAFTPDGKHIVTGSEDATLILWDPKSARALWRLTGADARFHQSAITNLAISDDSTLILSGSVDATAKLITLAAGEIISSFENHTDSVETIGFAHSMALAATGSVDGNINIWDTTTLRLRQTCKHEDSVIKLIWHPTAPFIYSCSVDQTVCMWDARTGACVRKWQGHQDSVLALALSPDGSFVVTGSDDGNSLVFQA